MKDLSYAKVAEMAAGETCPAQGTDFVLFSASAVALAAYSGTPAAGFLLIAVNFQRLGSKGFAVAALMLAILATWLAVLCLLFLPAIVSLPVGLALMVGTRLFALQVQGEQVAQHVSRGGRLASRWLALGAGAACLGAVIGASLAMVYLGGVSR